MQTLEARTRKRNSKPLGAGPILYWMQRDQRVQNNWALVKAQAVAKERGVPLLVLFNISTQPERTTLRHYQFMIAGLTEVQTELEALNISFWITRGDSIAVVTKFIKEHEIGGVVTDFNPLREFQKEGAIIADASAVSFLEVDAHNIIPCWIASNKEEFAAHTFRPKVHRQLAEFLIKIPKVVTHKHQYKKTPPFSDWEALLREVDGSVPAVDWLRPGTKAGKKQARYFINNSLDSYAEKRNNPNESALSNLSPYLRFGQVSAQWLALQVQVADAKKQSRDTYLEELIIRRELSDNYCFYNQEYDKITGAHDWAQKTLQQHKDDKREYLYTLEQFEQAETHDELWNAMQRQMVQFGKMHGWCRMYWAKKILEWTPNIQTAIDTALHLNDKYELDGCDPNGVVGVMWSICGVHDRAWTERPIFGKIRYMNYNGAKRKFNINEYIETHAPTEKKLFNE